MEKITSWLWREFQNMPPKMGSYWYDKSTNSLIITRGNQPPELSDERIPADLAMTVFEMRGRRRLFQHSQAAFDVMKARGVKARAGFMPPKANSKKP